MLEPDGDLGNVIGKCEPSKRYEDLLQPRWKNNLLMDGEAHDLLAGLIDLWGETKATGFLRQIAGRTSGEILAEALPQLILRIPFPKTMYWTGKGGVRSAKALRTLQAAGFTRVWNLTGGITRYSDDVDPTIPKY